MVFELSGSVYQFGFVLKFCKIFLQSIAACQFWEDWRSKFVRYRKKRIRFWSWNLVWLSILSTA